VEIQERVMADRQPVSRVQHAAFAPAAWAAKGWYDRELPVIRIHRGLVRYRRHDVRRFIDARRPSP